MNRRRLPSSFAIPLASFLLLTLLTASGRCATPPRRHDANGDAGDADANNDVVTFNVDGLTAGGVTASLSGDMGSRSPAQQHHELLLLDALARRRKPASTSSSEAGVDDGLVNLLGRMIPQSCRYRGAKYECGLSISCVLGGGRPLDLCSGGMIWACCVDREVADDRPPAPPALQNVSDLIQIVGNFPNFDQNLQNHHHNHHQQQQQHHHINNQNHPINNIYYHHQQLQPLQPINDNLNVNRPLTIYDEPIVIYNAYDDPAKPSYDRPSNPSYDRPPSKPSYDRPSKPSYEFRPKPQPPPPSYETNHIPEPDDYYTPDHVQVPLHTKPSRPQHHKPHLQHEDEQGWSGGGGGGNPSFRGNIRRNRLGG